MAGRKRFNRNRYGKSNVNSPRNIIRAYTAAGWHPGIIFRAIRSDIADARKRRKGRR